MTAPGAPDPHGLADIVDDLENRMAGETQHPDSTNKPDATDSSDDEDGDGSGGPVAEADLDLDDLTGAGAKPEPPEPPA